MKNLFLVVSLFVGVSFGAWSKAQALQTCAKAQSQPRKIFQKNSPNQEPELSPAMLAAIAKHRISKLAKVINTQSSHPLRFHFIRGFEKDWNILPGMKGEAQQSLLLKKLIAHLLKKSVFSTGPKIPMSQGETTVPLYVIDHAELGLHTDFDTMPEKMTVQMSLLKSANAVRSNVGKQSARNSLGIQNLKVVHLYMAYPDSIPANRMELLITQLKETYQADLLIISYGNALDGKLPLPPQALQFVGNQKPFARLSEIENDAFKGLAGGLVINDTIGNMQALHALSDLSVIVGPVNFFQPLNEGTKTLIINTKDARSFYEPSILNEMTDLAESSGGAITVKKWIDVPEALQAIVHLPEPIAPALIKNGNQSAFDKLLDRLLKLFLDYDLEH